MKFILQFISGISRLLQKVLEYFSGTSVSTFLALPAANVLPVTHALSLNDSKSILLSLETSL